jgi:prepilin-type N-terminal cleavage/methylation domain-containing protein
LLHIIMSLLNIRGRTWNVSCKIPSGIKVGRRMSFLITSINKRGFTLIELMTVIVIIGIFSALAIPGIMEIRYRNTLSDSVERVRSAGGAARDAAMQTRQATVLEVRSTGVWINLLSGARCDSDIEQRCITDMGGTSDGFIPLYEEDGLGEVSGTAMCGGVVLSSDDGEGACTRTAALVRSAGFALCYSGGGELFYRLGADANTACDSSSRPDGDVAWTRSCSTAAAVSVAFSDSSSYGLSDGAALMLNRYEADDGNAMCQSGTDMLDRRRLVVFPTNGAPFSQIGED